jgi:hypothetical protein
MWELDNKTPFAAERGWCRDRNGAEVWLVAVKGTFFIEPNGSLRVADKQPEVSIAPEYWADPTSSSLRYDSDLVPTKVATDVIVNGSAYAPYGRPVTQLDVTLTVNNRKKTLRVFGDRVWQHSALGLSISQPIPFIKLPIVYERAFGGSDGRASDPNQNDWEPRNPVGVGFATSARVAGMPLPNVEDPRSPLRGWTSRPTPAGFGAIAPHWLPRRRLGGTYDEKWERERLPLVPEDFEDAFYQCAPVDQQFSGFLKGGETIDLINLTSEGRLSFRLPRASLGFITYFGPDDRAVHRANLHSLILEPDVPTVSVVWHTALPCHAKVTKLMQTTIYAKKRLRDAQTVAAAEAPLNFLEA